MNACFNMAAFSLGAMARKPNNGDEKNGKYNILKCINRFYPDGLVCKFIDDARVV